MLNNVIFEAATEDRLPQIYRFLQDSFPTAEIRTYEDAKGVLSSPLYKMYRIFISEKEIGIISVWTLPSFCFIEHFAIFQRYRGKGYGSLVLKKIQSLYGKIVLEAEIPTDKTSLSRINFYSRAGFLINDCNYIQPPYRTGDDGIPLHLLSYPSPIENCTDCISEIYSFVYQRQYVDKKIP